MMRTLFAAMLVAVTTLVLAEPIEIVVPYSTGGPSDMLGRASQKYLMGKLEYPIVVINKPGADGRIAMRYVLQRPADGNTLIIAATGPFLFNRVIYNNLEYDTSEFDMVLPILRSPIGIIVGKDSAITNLREFIIAARTGKLNCGVSNSSSQFVAKHLLKRLELPNTELIPFKGSNDVLLGLLNNTLDCAIEPISIHIQPHLSRKVVIIATAAETQDPVIGRVDLLSSVIPGFTAYNWFGVALLKSAPAGKKDDLLKLIRSMHSDHEFQQSMAALGFEIVTKPIDSTAYINSEYEKLEAARRHLGITKIE